MHLEQILKNLENEFGTLYQKTGLKSQQLESLMIIYPFSRFKSFGFNGLSLKVLIRFSPNFAHVITRIR